MTKRRCDGADGVAVMVKPRFYNSATLSVPDRLLHRQGRWATRELVVQYGVFEHPVAGRCLIDTGYSDRVLRGRRSLALRLYAAILRPRLTDAALPAAQPDIDTIILTHLHADHVSAVKDYPDARILLDGAALDTLIAQSRTARLRHGCFDELLPADLAERAIDIRQRPRCEAPFGLEHGWDLFGDGSVVAIDLPGHMTGHLGLLFPQRERPLLYAVDTAWTHHAIDTPSLPGYPARAVLDDARATLASIERVHRFQSAGGEVVLCHDVASC